MARLSFRDLLKAIVEHPDYFKEWQDDVPASQSLRIVVAEPQGQVRSEVFELANGGELILDVSSDDEIVGIEFS